MFITFKTKTNLVNPEISLKISKVKQFRMQITDFFLKTILPRYK